MTLGYREINDFLGAVSYAKVRAPEARVGVLAYSMGAAVAIMAGAETSAVEAFVLDSPFATHRRVLAYNFRRVAHLPFGLVAPLADQLLWRLAGYHLREARAAARDRSPCAPTRAADPGRKGLAGESTGRPAALPGGWRAERTLDRPGGRSLWRVLRGPSNVSHHSDHLLRPASEEATISSAFEEECVKAYQTREALQAATSPSPRPTDSGCRSSPGSTVSR